MSRKERMRRDRRYNITFGIIAGFSIIGALHLFTMLVYLVTRLL